MAVIAVDERKDSSLFTRGMDGTVNSRRQKFTASGTLTKDTDSFEDPDTLIVPGGSLLRQIAIIAGVRKASGKTGAKLAVQQRTVTGTQMSAWATIWDFTLVEAADEYYPAARTHEAFTRTWQEKREIRVLVTVTSGEAIAAGEDELIVVLDFLNL